MSQARRNYIAIWRRRVSVKVKMTKHASWVNRGSRTQTDEVCGFGGSQMALKESLRVSKLYCPYLFKKINK